MQLLSSTIIIGGHLSPRGAKLFWLLDKRTVASVVAREAAACHPPLLLSWNSYGQTVAVRLWSQTVCGTEKLRFSCYLFYPKIGTKCAQSTLTAKIVAAASRLKLPTCCAFQTRVKTYGSKINPCDAQNTQLFPKGN